MVAERAVVRAPVARAVHHEVEVRPQLDRQQRRLVRPVLEDPSVGEEARDGLRREGADARADREPVRAIDGRDRVELHRRQPANRVLHVALGRAAESGCEALAPDDQAPDALSRSAIAVPQRACAR